MTTLPEEYRAFFFCAVICTVISVMLLVAFLKHRKKPRFKLPATVCLLSSAFGTILVWLAPVVYIYQKEVSYLSLKLIALGGAFILYPFVLFSGWVVDYLAIIFKLNPREQRILFHIGKIGIRFSDIIGVIIMILFGYLVLHIMLMK